MLLIKSNCCLYIEKKLQIRKYYLFKNSEIEENVNFVNGSCKINATEIYKINLTILCDLS